MRLGKVYDIEGQTPQKAARECEVRPTPHAKTRQAQRGISEEEIRDVVGKGSPKRVTDRGDWEAKNRFMEVDFVLRPCNIFIETVKYV